MQVYQELLHKIITHGEVKNTRTQFATLAIPPQHLVHDMADGFPLLTTKRVAPQNDADRA